MLDAGRAKRSQSSGATPEEPNATKRALSGRLCWMRRARKGPRALGRLRKSLTRLNALSLEGSVGCGAREESNGTKRALSGRLCWMRRARKGPRAHGAAPEECKRALSGRLCWMRRARKGPRALGRLRKSLTRLNALSPEGSVGCGAREKVPELWGGSGRV